MLDEPLMVEDSLDVLHGEPCLIGDADGVVVLPPPIAAEVLAEAKEQERQEEFIASRVALGEPLDGLFPLSDARRPDYEAWLAQQPPPAPRQTRHDPSRDTAEVAGTGDGQ